MGFELTTAQWLIILFSCVGATWMHGQLRVWQEMDKPKWREVRDESNYYG